MKSVDHSLQFIRNVRYLTKGSTGEFESSVGVCRGYLARAEQGGIQRMSMDIALRMAKQLGYTVEELSEKDFIKHHQIAEIDAEIAVLNEKREELVK